MGGIRAPLDYHRRLNKKFIRKAILFNILLWIIYIYVDLR